MKIKLVHLLLDEVRPTSISEDGWSSYLNRQNISKKSLEKISKNLYKYTQINNKVFTGPPPIETCNDPETYVSSPDLIPKDGRPWISSYHYGAFMSHRDAILTEFSEELDAIVIVEGDVVVSDEFTEVLKSSYDFGLENSASFITFANTIFGEGSEAQERIEDFGDWQKIDHFLCCNCYMIFKSERKNIQEKLINAKWMEFDIWLYWNYDKRVPIFKTKNPVAYETSGFSIIDQKQKSSNYLP
jgi:hypothetical protein